MTQDKIIVAVTEREKEWMQAWIDKDEQKFTEILSDDFVLSSARGQFMNKQQWIQTALGPFTCTQFEWKDIKVRIYDSVAVVNSITSQKANVGSEDWSGDFIVTDVWVNKSGNWQVVARHGTGPLNK
jgi:hypothetical protein